MSLRTLPYNFARVFTARRWVACLRKIHAAVLSVSLTPTCY